LTLSLSRIGIEEIFQYFAPSDRGDAGVDTGDVSKDGDIAGIVTVLVVVVVIDVVDVVVTALAIAV